MRGKNSYLSIPVSIANRDENRRAVARPGHSCGGEVEIKSRRQADMVFHGGLARGTD